MKQTLLLLCLFFTQIGWTQDPGNYEGPFPKITAGYGAWGAYDYEQIKFTNTWAVDPNNIGGPHDGDELTIRYPKGQVGPFPTVLFNSGWSQTQPEVFNSLLAFIASKGYAVVFTPYKANNGAWNEEPYQGMNQAINEYPDIIDKTRIGFFGHSLGAGVLFDLANRFYKKDHQYGSNAKFIFSVAGWIGFDITRDELATFPQDCPLLVQIWEEDDYVATNDPTGGTDPRIQYDLFATINIPLSEKNYVRVLGGPDQAYNGGTYHYDTGHGLVKQEQYNALDYYALFRMLDAMMDYTFGENPGAKDIALGFNPDMGPFPDLDTDYNTFVFAHEPASYDFQCDVTANPHKDFCPDAPLPLPVTMLKPFTAIQKNEQVLLTWATAEEYQNKGFEIQRSSDLQRWTTLAWLNGKGQANQYQALDANPNIGNNYYRLKQIDLDERFQFSNIEVVLFNSSKNQIVISPNPTTDILHFSKASSLRIEQVKITDLTGKTLILIEQPESDINISELKAGVYFVTFQTNSTHITTQLVKY